MVSQGRDAAYLGGTGVWPMTFGAAYWSQRREVWCRRRGPSMVSHYLAHGLDNGCAQAATEAEQSARHIRDLAAKTWQSMCGVMPTIRWEFAYQMVDYA